MMKSIAVVGAGLAGAICAARLSREGHAVTVYEKSGGTGGRLSTRRGPEGAFDHGAQYVTARQPAMQQLVSDLQDHDAVVRWVPEGKDRPGDWYVGLPGMSGFVKPLLDGIDVRLRTQIEQVVPHPSGGASVAGKGFASEPYDHVIVTAPAPQAHALIGTGDLAFAPLADVLYAPCWAAMVAFDAPLTEIADLVRGNDDAPLGLIVRNGSKPHRDAATYILHAGGAWSGRHLEQAPAEVLPVMLDALARLAGRTIEPRHAAAHRWRYARVDRAAGVPFLASADRSIIVCGDGLLGGRAEAAAESAFAVCAALGADGGQAAPASP